MALFFTKINESLLVNPDEATKYIEQNIWKICLAHEEKHEEWETSVVNSAQGIMYLAKGNKLPQPQLASEETIAKEKSSLDATLKQQLTSKIKCFQDATEKGLKAALGENERVELERFTYLEMPFEWFPKYTPLFFRRTNMAEYCLIITGYHVRCSELMKQDPKKYANKEIIYYEAIESPVEANMNRSIKKIAGSLAGALLNGILGKVGVLIFEAIFPPGLPSYFDEVYKEIERIVNQAITQNTIAQVNGKINAMKNWVSITYANAKESGTMSKQELTNLIRARESDIAINLIGVLKEEQFAKPGLCVFMIAGGMHLAILQELAYVDPKANVPSASHYVNSIKQYAKMYADHATATFNSIADTRLRMIWPENKFRLLSGVRYYWYSYHDDYFGTKSKTYMMTCDTKGCNNAGAENERNHAMGQYKETVKRDLLTKMGDPLGIANDWLKLQSKPLPK